MQLSGLILAIAGLAPSALAAAVQTTVNLDVNDASVTVYPNGVPAELKPHEAANQSLNTRANAGVYLCTDSYFNGYCVHIVQPEYVCVNLSSDLNDQVSSVGPDSPKYCLFYSAFNCLDSEGHFGTYSPGYNDLSALSFNDKISSYICHPN
ncbi:hypothetical protein F5Y14DRAFT_448180 [Nemania sp. NC0429]|nr:hypothetical protein F5Y14DRAFT_448180 [Nemania sp. NC0429]